MRKGIFFVLFIGFIFSGFAQAKSPIEGYWKSIDDDTKKVTAFWKLEIKNGKLNGHIVSYPDAKEDDKCTKCKGNLKEFYNKPVKGTVWLHLSEEVDGQWKAGYIIDSGEGEMYDAKVWIEEGNLHVRGYIAFFYKTQVWLKMTPEEVENGVF